MIKDWHLPLHGTPLQSFIDLCAFYNCYCPWFETNVKPLRIIQRSYHCIPIPTMDWSSFHVSLFNTCKSNIPSSPLFLCYNSSKPVSLKTDWSTNGMGYILMQPDNSSDSLKTLRTLEESGNCFF